MERINVLIYFQWLKCVEKIKSIKSEVQLGKLYYRSSSSGCLLKALLKYNWYNKMFKVCIMIHFNMYIHHENITLPYS